MQIHEEAIGTWTAELARHTAYCKLDAAYMPSGITDHKRPCLRDSHGPSNTAPGWAVRSIASPLPASKDDSGELKGPNQTRKHGRLEIASTFTENNNQILLGAGSGHQGAWEFRVGCRPGPDTT